MNLDPETVEWYRLEANKAIERLTQALRKEQPEEETKMTRARIKAMEEVVSWKQRPTTPDDEIKFL